MRVGINEAGTQELSVLQDRSRELAILRPPLLRVLFIAQECF